MPYAFNNVKWGQDDLGRSGGIVTWSMSLAGLVFDTSRYTLADFESAMQAAFDTWESIANIDFERQASAAGVDIDVGTDTLAGSTVGLATYSYTNGANDGDGIDTLTFVDIDMDLQPTWTPYGESGLSFYAVALHEIGHGIGLDHYNDPNEIMNPTISRDDLGPGDIEGIQTLYGARTYGTDADENWDLSATGIEQAIHAGGGNDSIVGSGGSDNLFGGAGNDNIDGFNGNDRIIDTLGTNTLSGGANNDVIIGGIGTLTGDGGTGADILIGGAGNDSLSGGAGNDTLRGDPTNGFFFGNDRLSAGTGTDYLEGGSGADVFIFQAGEGTNYIAALNISLSNPNATTTTGVDFQSGLDQVDLTAFGYSSTTEVFDQIADSGGHAVFTDQGTTIHFVGLVEADLGTSDFLL